jgi:hypothetical protein
MKTKPKTSVKVFLERIASKTFWYDVSLRTTIWKTIKKTKYFDKTDIYLIKASYVNLKKLNAYLIDDVQSEYHLSWCCIILSIYNMCLSKGITQSESIDITEKIIFTNMKTQSISKFIESSLDKSKDPFSFMILSSKNQESNFFGKTFIFDRTIDTKDSYHLKIKKCFYYDYFKSNNSPELMKIACKWDMVSWTQGIVTKKHRMIFQRPLTLGLDNKDCEFNFDRIAK